MVHYESAQAHMEEQMRKAAVWRMQRAALDARKAARKSTHKAKRSGSWIAAISKAFGGNFKGETEAADSFSDN
jgi:hypothetical protein